MAESAGASTALGTDGESPAEGSIPETPTVLDPTAAALAADNANSDPELAREAAAYFRRQSHLVEIQTEHLHEQRAVSLQLLKLKRLDVRLKVGLQLFVVLFASVIGIIGAMFLHDAITSRSVIIEPFEVSPSLSAKSFSGKIVAAEILDKLNQIQAATQGTTEKTALTSAWDRDIRIEVAETGLSVGELLRVLRERFGHDIRIDGVLLETPTSGLVLTVRGSNVVPKTFSGSVADFPELTRDAADYLYSQARPALWATYLASNGRNAEAIEVARSAIHRTDPVERARLFDMWSNAVGDSGGSLQEALSLAQEAVRLNPADWGAHNDLQQWLITLGQEEASYRAGNKMRELAGGRPGRAPEIQYNYWDMLTGNVLAAMAVLTADINDTGGAGTNFGPGAPWLAWMQALLHDPDAAQFTLTNFQDDHRFKMPSAVLHMAQATIADELGETAHAAEEWQAFAKEYKQPEVANVLGSPICFVAPALERAGRHSDADASLADSAKLTFVDCYRFRGEILDSRGDWAGAQEWYEKAVKLAPDLPAGYYSWGLALARHGDRAGAEAKLRDAHQRGPHWADPLKAWGDVLVKQGETREALRKYEEALNYAPNWKQLKESHDAAAKQKT